MFVLKKSGSWEDTDDVLENLVDRNTEKIINWQDSNCLVELEEVDDDNNTIGRYNLYTDIKIVTFKR